jgi:FkbM family methyltransferase
MSTVNLPVGAVNDRIPRYLHQTWKTEDIPDKHKPFQKTFTDMHPKWQYKLWTDQDNEQLIEKHYSWFLEYYRGYPHNIQRADAARYFILYHFGGVYADLDMQCLTPLDPLLDQIGGIIVGQEGQTHSDGTQRIGNAIIFSSPHHPFWLHVFQGLLECYKKSDVRKISTVFTTTGPSFLHEVYLKYPQGITVMANSAFYPLPWHKPEDDGEMKLVQRRQYPKSWTAHHWAGVWRSAPRQINVVYQDSHRHFSMYFILPRNKSEGFGIVEQHLAKGLVYRQALIEKWAEFLQPGDNVIQVGAYIGNLTIPLGMLVKNPEGEGGEVHAFEPDTRTRALLADTVLANRLNNVKIYDCMATSQTIRMYRTNKINTMKPHRLVWRAQQPNAVDICLGTPLDAVLIQAVALIHIDACGEEYSVLQGAEQIIRRDRPILTIDIWPDQRRQEYNSPIRQDQVFGLLQRLKYHYEIIESSTYLCTPEEMDEEEQQVQ